MDLRQALRDALAEHTPDNVGASRVERILNDVWPTIEPLVFTGMQTGTSADNMHAETWRERAERQGVELARLRPLAGLLADLDRCEHGRHEGDHCWGCEDGPSKGNPIMRLANGVGLDYLPFLRDQPRRTIGFRYDRSPIVVPGAEERSNVVEAWRA